MKYKVESKCGRKKEIEAFSKCELDGKIVKDFDFKIEEIKQNFPCKFIGLAQRDDRWKNDKLGSSIYTVGDFGCLITGISSLSFWGCTSQTPDILAKELSFTSNGSLLWNSITRFKPLGMEFVYRYYGYNKKKLLEILGSSHNVAVVEVPFGGGRHWMAVTGYSDTKGFQCFDPWKDDYCYATERYSRITGFAELKFLK